MKPQAPQYVIQFILTPIPATACRSCGHVPDTPVNARGHCAECADLRAGYAFTKQMEARK
jgi:hypothetical protein